MHVKSEAGKYSGLLRDVINSLGLLQSLHTIDHHSSICDYHIYTYKPTKTLHSMTADRVRFSACLKSRSVPLARSPLFVFIGILQPVELDFGVTAINYINNGLNIPFSDVIEIPYFSDKGLHIWYLHCIWYLYLVSHIMFYHMPVFWLCPPLLEVIWSIWCTKHFHAKVYLNTAKFAKM